MELRSRRRRRRSRARHHLGPRGGADRLSALTDDLLLEILVHVGCARTAARFGLLSRRWRGLWAGLPEVVLHDVPFQSLEPALARVTRPALSRVDIRVDKRLWPGNWPNVSRVTSLLRAAQRLSPEELAFTIPSLFGASYKSIDLPAFHGATSIRLESGLLRARPPPAGEGDFSALQTLSLSGCIVHDLHAMVSRCPRLRVLTYRTPRGDYVEHLRIKVHSASLEELVVESEGAVTKSIDIVAPVLKQLTSSFSAIQGRSMSILAPMVEQCTFAYLPHSWMWGLTSLSLSIVTCNAHAPSSLDIHACFGFCGLKVANHSLGQHIDKHLVADISVLNLHLKMRGHVFGTFVLHLLERGRIHGAIRRLKVHLLRPEDKERHIHCSCHDDQMRTVTQIVTLTNLEEVEIDGIEGVDHELDFLKLLFRCAPMLTIMNVRLSEMYTPTEDACKKIYNIFKAYPSVQCYVYLRTNTQVLHE